MRDSHLTWCRTPLPAAVPRTCPRPLPPALQTDQTTRMREQTESPERWVWETASGQDCLYSEVPEGKRKVRALEDVREGSSPSSGRRRGARGLLGSVRAPRPCTHTHTHTHNITPLGCPPPAEAVGSLGQSPRGHLHGVEGTRRAWVRAEILPGCSPPVPCQGQEQKPSGRSLPDTSFLPPSSQIGAGRADRGRKSTASGFRGKSAARIWAPTPERSSPRPGRLLPARPSAPSPPA